MHLLYEIFSAWSIDKEQIFFSSLFLGAYGFRRLLVYAQPRWFGVPTSHILLVNSQCHALWNNYLLIISFDLTLNTGKYWFFCALEIYFKTTLFRWSMLFSADTISAWDVILEFNIHNPMMKPWFSQFKNPTISIGTKYEMVSLLKCNK